MFNRSFNRRNLFGHIKKSDRSAATITIVRNVKDLLHFVKEVNFLAQFHIALLYYFTHKYIAMLVYHFNTKIVFAFFSILLCCAAFKAKAGLDSYEIYLNNKLILKQYVNQPLALDGLGLDQSHINDQLVIYYSQCNAPNKLGKGRSISVKDAEGRMIKTWNFADAKNGKTGMRIPVKELLELQSKKPISKISIYYNAEGHGGQLLANFHFGDKSTTLIKTERVGNKAAVFTYLFKPLSFYN